MRLFDYTKCFGEKSNFLWKMPIFDNFGPLGAGENIHIFLNFYIFFNPFQKATFFAFTFQYSKFLFFTARYYTTWPEYIKLAATNPLDRIIPDEKQIQAAQRPTAQLYAAQLYTASSSATQHSSKLYIERIYFRYLQRNLFLLFTAMVV